MIPTLIFLLIRRYNRRHPGMIRKYILLTGKIILAVVALCLVHNAAAQSNELLYDVVRYNKKSARLKYNAAAMPIRYGINWNRISKYVSLFLLPPKRMKKPFLRTALLFILLFTANSTERKKPVKKWF
ncbi:MAG: hypothetical protein HC867_00705 [Bacteroidia bacterium]|nr:hypothetical protein [Bacteroidia bacterium]